MFFLLGLYVNNADSIEWGGKTVPFVPVSCFLICFELFAICAMIEMGAQGSHGEVGMGFFRLLRAF